MKLSLALFAAANADVEVNADTLACQAAGGIGVPNLDFKNCWAPYGHFASANATAPDYDENKPFVLTNSEGECGFLYSTPVSMANSTCTYSFGTVPGVSEFGNGAFVTASGDLVGLDFSGDVSVIRKWTETFDKDQIETDFNTALSDHIAELKTNPNATFSWENPAVNCWDESYMLDNFSVSCTDNGAPTNELAIMITNQDADAEGNQFAIANYGDIDNVITVELNVPCTNVQPLDANAAIISPVSNTNSCAFTIQITSTQAQLLYFQADNSAVVDFFNVSLQ